VQDAFGDVWSPSQSRGGASAHTERLGRPRSSSWRVLRFLDRVWANLTGEDQSRKCPKIKDFGTVSGGLGFSLAAVANASLHPQGNACTATRAALPALRCPRALDSAGGERCGRTCRAASSARRSGRKGSAGEMGPMMCRQAAAPSRRAPRRVRQAARHTARHAMRHAMRHTVRHAMRRADVTGSKYDVHFQPGQTRALPKEP